MQTEDRDIRTTIPKPAVRKQSAANEVAGEAEMSDKRSCIKKGNWHSDINEEHKLMSKSKRQKNKAVFCPTTVENH